MLALGLEEDEAVLAKERQLATLKQNPDKEIIPERSQGQARDKAAAEMG